MDPLSEVLSLVNSQDSSFGALKTGGRGLRDYTRERYTCERELAGDSIICDDWGYMAAPRTVTRASPP